MSVPPSFCSSCGSPLHPGARFCTGCGTASAHAGAPAAPAHLPAQVPAQMPTPVPEMAFAAVPIVPATPAPVPTPPAPLPAPPGFFAPVTVVPAASQAAPPQHWAVPSAADPLARIGEQLREVPLSTLVPLRTWWTDGAWRRGWIGLFLLFAIAPFALLQATAEDDDVTRIAWGFALYFAAAWFMALAALIRPERQQPWLLVRVALFTALAGVAIAIALEESFDPGDSWAAMVFGVGLPEEFAKGLAVWLFLTRFSNVAWSTRTYVFVGAVSGLAFGTAEAVTYSVAYEAAAPYFSTTDYTSVLVWRLLSGGLFHACMAGIVAYFIGLAAYSRQRPWLLIALGVMFSAVLHGTYNRLSEGWGGAAVAALIIFVFAGYVRSGDQIAHEYSASEAAAR